MNRTEQKEKRRQQILEVALDQFIRRGYAATKITDIASAANMSTGLLFHYFESKEQLFTELIQLGVEGPKGMLGAIGEVEPLQFFEICAQMTLKYAAESEFTAKMFVLMGSVYYSEGIPESAKGVSININFYQETVPLLIAGQNNGTIRQGDPLALNITFWTALQGSVEAYALNEGLPLPQPEWIVDIIKEKK